MANPDRGPDVDQSALSSDDVLERELREALKSEGEIELFKKIQDSLAVESELRKNPLVRKILHGMWDEVAVFFALVTEADTLAGLDANDPLVLGHQRMAANFSVVAGINQTFKDAAEAEGTLRAVDDMGHTIEDAEQ